MGRVSPAVCFTGIFRKRGRGTGMKRVMEGNPEIGEFIRSFTSWERVEPGSLNVDDADPLPLAALGNVRPLAQEPEDLAKNMNPGDAQISEMRGAPAYYGGVARAGSYSRPVVLRRQPRPACPHRLEIIADVFLRSALHVCDGDEVSVDVYHAEDWLAIMGAKSGSDEVFRGHSPIPGAEQV